MKDINLIRKIAWSFHNTTGIPYEELFSEASLAYCEFQNRWKKNWYKEELPASETTATKIFIESRLIEFARAEKRAKHISTDIEGVFNYLSNKVFENANFEFGPDFSNSSKINFTKEVKEVIQTIFEAPEDFAMMTAYPARRLIREKLEKKGWNSWTIQEAFRKTKKVVNEMPYDSFVLTN